MGYRKNGNKRELDECPHCLGSRITERSRLRPKYRCSDCKECFDKPRVKKWTVKERIVSACPECFSTSVSSSRCNNCGNRSSGRALRPAVPSRICRECGALWLATYAKAERACDAHREQLRANMKAKTAELSERTKCCCCVLGREHERASHADPPPPKTAVCRHQCGACSVDQACAAHCTRCGCRRSNFTHLHCVFCSRVVIFADSPKGETYACQEFVCHHCFYKDRTRSVARLKAHGCASDEAIADYEKSMEMLREQDREPEVAATQAHEKAVECEEGEPKP